MHGFRMYKIAKGIALALLTHRLGAVSGFGNEYYRQKDLNHFGENVDSFAVLSCYVVWRMTMPAIRLDTENHLNDSEHISSVLQDHMTYNNSHFSVQSWQGLAQTEFDEDI